MPSTPSKKRSENPRGPKGKPAKGSPKAAPVKRAPKTREAEIAVRANDYATGKDNVSFGAPVSATQVAYYEEALKRLTRGKSPAQAMGFKSREIAVRELGKVARGTAKSSALPKDTRAFFTKLGEKLDGLHRANGQVNKTWPRKHAIVLHALLSAKPAPAKRKPKAEPKPQPQPEVAATA